MARINQLESALPRALAAAGIAAVLVVQGSWSLRDAAAAVATTGDVTPTPPAAGGTVNAPFRVGQTGLGTIAVTLGTPVNVTGGNAIFGDAAAGTGVATLNGLGSNLTTTGLLIVGNNGVGSISASAAARIIVGDDATLGVTGNASGDVFVDGLGSTFTVTDKLVIGDAGNSLVQLTAGGKATAANSTIGQSAGSDGRLTVSGRLSTMQHNGAMTLGDAGRGEVQVASQGIVRTGNLLVGNSSTGVGLAVVSGAGSAWDVEGILTLGVNGLGTLNVLDGAQMSATGAVRLANIAGSEAHMIVSGSTSTFTAATSLRVGENGVGTLDIRNGARVTTGNAILGDNLIGRGDVLVDGLGSVWKINGSLDVSEPGEAQLAITGGGLVTTTGAIRIAARGRLIMNAARLETGSTLTNNGSIQGTGRIVGAVSNTGSGIIRVTPGNSLLMVNNLINSANIELNGGELEVQGGAVNNKVIDARFSILRFGGAGLDNNDDAQLAITGGTVEVFGAVDNNAGAKIVVGAGSTAVFHGTLVNSGDFFITQGSEAFVLNDLSFTPSSLLNVTIGSDDETPQFAHLDAGGEAALDGTLGVTLAPGYAPSLGDSFAVLTAAEGVGGTFDATTLPTLGGGKMWDLDYGVDSVTLSVVAGLRADFNSDGTVNAADLTLWRIAFGADDLVADADGDGDTDGNDFLIWQQELGASVSAGTAAAASAVPEPAGAALVAIGLALIAPRRGRNRPVF